MIVTRRKVTGSRTPRKKKEKKRKEKKRKTHERGVSAMGSSFGTIPKADSLGIARRDIGGSSPSGRWVSLRTPMTAGPAAIRLCLLSPVSTAALNLEPTPKGPAGWAYPPSRDSRNSWPGRRFGVGFSWVIWNQRSVKVNGLRQCV